MLASHYDVLTGDASGEAAFIRGNVERRRSGAITLLDVACGTGVVTALLAGAYQVSGLDISPGMLAVARQRLPQGTPLYQADMSRFDLNVTFDAVVCSFRAVNHLLDFTAWRGFFDCVHRHLNDGGTFLFDVATISYLTMESKVARTVGKFDDNYLRRTISDIGQGTFEWRVEIFELQRDGRYKILRELLTMRSFPLDDIRQALGRGFTDIETIDRQGNAVSEENAVRTWFVCTKPAGGGLPESFA
jgi:SAM-dependent methyltransferase